VSLGFKRLARTLAPPNLVTAVVLTCSTTPSPGRAPANFPLFRFGLPAILFAFEVNQAIRLTKNKSPGGRLKIIGWTTFGLQPNLYFMKQDRPQNLISEK
jgi:hypothetical protein